MNYEMSGDYTSLKSARRQWNKSPNDCDLMGFSRPDNIPPNHNENNEINKRYEDYLFNLHLNNKINQIANKKDKKKEELEKLENGFNLFTNGAHQAKEKYTPRYTTASKSSLNSKRSQHITPRSNCKSSPLLRHFEQQMAQDNSQESGNIRKKWANASFTLKTADGCQIKINGPNKYDKPSIKKPKDNRVKSSDCDYYSDDFESESDGEYDSNKSDTNASNKEKQKTNNSSNLIESVMFSDCSEDEEKELSKKQLKKSNEFVFKLTANDAKFLRESMNETNFSMIRESLLVNKQNSSNEKDNEILEVIDEDSSFNETDNSIEESSVCDFILKRAVDMKKEDRQNLMNFLSNIDN